MIISTEEVNTVGLKETHKRENGKNTKEMVKGYINMQTAD